LTFWQSGSRYPSTCCRPVVKMDFRRGFKIPEQSSPLAGSSLKTRVGLKRAVRIH
jgi:hypothetical protein